MLAPLLDIRVRPFVVELIDIVNSCSGILKEYFEERGACRQLGAANMARWDLLPSVVVAYEMSTIGHCTAVRDVHVQCTNKSRSLPPGFQKEICFIEGDTNSDDCTYSPLYNTFSFLFKVYFHEVNIIFDRAI